MTTEASPGPRTVTARLRYRNDEDRVRRSESLDLPVTIGEERDDFLVTAPDAALTAGSGATVALAVENNRAETVSDVEAKLYADDPISAPDDEGYVASLAPGESADVIVRLAAAEGAVPGKTYPVSVDFTYETADGDRKISDTYRVPVTTRASTGSPLPAVAVAVLLVIAALVLWLKRDRLTRRLRR